MSLKTIYLSICLLLIGSVAFAQQGSVSINQNPEITALLKLKKEVNSENSDKNRYKISIYSGSRAGAERQQAKYNSNFSSWSSIMEYEPPNYKIYVGNFKNALERDRALQKIKKKFPYAFPVKLKD